MQKSMLAALAAIAVATLSLAVVPAFTSTAMAAKGGVNPGEECVGTHNGNGRPVDCEDIRGNSASETTFCKVHGKFVPENPDDDNESCDDG
jgi:hypothetical protein